MVLLLVVMMMMTPEHGYSPPPEIKTATPNSGGYDHHLSPCGNVSIVMPPPPAAPPVATSFNDKLISHDDL